MKYGIFYLREKDFFFPSTLTINGVSKNFRFNNTTKPEFIYEFQEICLHDCYKLKQLRKALKSVDVIVDIGANQGLFAIAARQNFPTSSINCYEPNNKLKPILDQNAAQLKAEVFYEAVTKEDCKVLLNFGESDLHTTTSPHETGNVTGIAFRKLIERAGGKIDILKMDCEGAEWEILQDTFSWANIRSVTMEYHLWAKIDITVEKMFNILNSLGFIIISNRRLSEQFGLITALKISPVCK